MNKLFYFNMNNMKLGEVEVPNYQLSIRYVVEHAFSFPESIHAVYLADNEEEFYVYEINSFGSEFSAKLVI